MLTKHKAGHANASITRLAGGTTKFRTEFTRSIWWLNFKRDRKQIGDFIVVGVWSRWRWRWRWRDGIRRRGTREWWLHVERNCEHVLVCWVGVVTNGGFVWNFCMIRLIVCKGTTGLMPEGPVGSGTARSGVIFLKNYLRTVTLLNYYYYSP